MLGAQAEVDAGQVPCLGLAQSRLGSIHGLLAGLQQRVEAHGLLLPVVAGLRGHVKAGLRADTFETSGNWPPDQLGECLATDLYAVARLDFGSLECVDAGGNLQYVCDHR
ncbi:hypothetical protein D3C84_890320 [compost metagenome]